MSDTTSKMTREELSECLCLMHEAGVKGGAASTRGKIELSAEYSVKAMGFVFRVLDTYDVMEKVCAKVNRQECSASVEHWKANHKCERDKKQKVSAMLSVAHRRIRELEAEAVEMLAENVSLRDKLVESKVLMLLIEKEVIEIKGLVAMLGGL